MELLKIRKKYLDLSEEELMEFCAELRHQVKIEKTSYGELIFNHKTFIYDSQKVVEKDFSETLKAEPVLPGFTLNLEQSGFSD